MRPRTITVDVSRGGDYALWDYRRQHSIWWPVFVALREFAATMASLEPLFLKVSIAAKEVSE